MRPNFEVRPQEIYMDNAATTVIDGEVVAAMQPYLEERYGNPQTPYHLGREAKDAIETARSQVADLLGCKPEEIYFTSGGTEANNWAIKGFLCQRTRLVVSAVEHKSVLEPARWMAKRGLFGDLAEIPVDGDGRVRLDILESYLKTGLVGLVSVQYANNEVGTIQPVGAISELCSQHGATFHCDAVQAYGKTLFKADELGAGMISLSAHKIHGPMGVGALYVKQGTPIEPLLHGGGHEQGLRSGTHPVPQIVGFGKAAELAWSAMKSEMPRISRMVEFLAGELKIKLKAVRNGLAQDRLPNILNVTFPGKDASLLCGILGRHGICVSMGSACRTGSGESHVLKAMGKQYKDCTSSIRISLSRYTEQQDAIGLVARMQSAMVELDKRDVL